MIENWKDVPGYEGLYQASSFGNIKSFIQDKKGKVMKLSHEKDGYFQVSFLGKRKFKVHRLIAITFIEKIEGKEHINHKNGIKDDNRIENIEWCTPSENHLHKYKILGYKSNFQINHPRFTLGKKGIEHNTSKKVNQCDLSGNLIKKWDCIKDVERELKIFVSNISACCRNKQKTAGGFTWKY